MLMNLLPQANGGVFFMLTTSYFFDNFLVDCLRNSAFFCTFVAIIRTAVEAAILLKFN